MPGDAAGHGVTKVRSQLAAPGSGCCRMGSSAVVVTREAALGTPGSAGVMGARCSAPAVSPGRPRGPPCEPSPTAAGAAARGPGGPAIRPRSRSGIRAQERIPSLGLASRSPQGVSAAPVGGALPSRAGSVNLIQNS